MHGTYDAPKKGKPKGTDNGKPIMAKKPVPKAPPTPKGTENGKRPGKPFPAKGG